MRWLLPFLFACASPVLDVPTDATTESLIVGRLSETPSFVALPKTEVRFVELPFDMADADLVAFLYPRSLDAMQIQEGPLAALTEPICGAEGGRPIPPGRLELFTEATDARPLAWRELGLRPPMVDQFRIAPLDLAACLDGGGCLQDGACSQTCPEVMQTILPPAPVETPGDPMLQTPGQRCAPAGEAMLAGEMACGPVGRACGVTPWPERPPSLKTWYVQAGAAGNGERPTAPFGTLAEALAVAEDHHLILLSDGVYTAPIDVPEGRILTVIGRCASAVRLEGDVTSRGRRFRLENVTLTGAVRVDHGATALAGIRMEGAGPTGLSAKEDGLIQAERMVVQDRLAPVTVEGEGEIDVDGLNVFDAEDAAIVVGGSVRLIGATLQSVRAGRAVDGGRLSLVRTRLSASAEGVQVERAGRFEAADLLLDAGLAVVDARDGSVSLTRTVLHGGDLSMVTSTATLADTRFSEGSVRVAGSALVLDRVQFEAAPWAPADLVARLTDVAMVSSGGLDLSGTVELTRMNVEGAPGPALRMGRGNLRAEDLFLSGGGVRLDLGADGIGQLGRLEIRGAETGLEIQSGGVSVTDLLVDDATVALSSEVPFTLGPTRLANSDLAVRLARCGIDPAVQLEAVQFQNNGRRVEAR